MLDSARRQNHAKVGLACNPQAHNARQSGFGVVFGPAAGDRRGVSPGRVNRPDGSTTPKSPWRAIRGLLMHAKRGLARFRLHRLHARRDLAWFCRRTEAGNLQNRHQIRMTRPNHRQDRGGMLEASLDGFNLYRDVMVLEVVPCKRTLRAGHDQAFTTLEHPAPDLRNAAGNEDGGKALAV